MAMNVSERQQWLATLAERHDLSSAAVTHLYDAVAAGGGHMAMFDHPELGGPGQWMRGGMILLGQASNHALKARVDALCHEIGDRVIRSADTPAPWQQQTQRSGRPEAVSAAGASRFESGGAWWPRALGTPNATGSYPNGRYAYFADAARLALDTPEGVAVYDTGDHRITGFAQQSGGGRASITLTSQHGTVDLAQLHRVDARGDTPNRGESRAPASQVAGDTDVLDMIERLGDLKAKGLLSEDEFAAKKAELLGRL